MVCAAASGCGIDRRQSLSLQTLLGRLPVSDAALFVEYWRGRSLRARQEVHCQESAIWLKATRRTHCRCLFQAGRMTGIIGDLTQRIPVWEKRRRLDFSSSPNLASISVPALQMS